MKKQQNIENFAQYSS